MKNTLLSMVRFAALLASLATISGCATIGGPLITAADKGQLSALREALDQGADIEERGLCGGWDVGGDSGATPLFCAAHGGHFELVKELVARGADVNAKSNGFPNFGRTPLTAAVYARHAGIVRFLIEKGADVDYALAKLSELRTTHPEEYAFLQGIIEKPAESKAVEAGVAKAPPPAEVPKIDLTLPVAAAPNYDAIAVIIGNRSYLKGAPSVDFAQNDAKLVKNFVVRTLGYREGNVIDLRDATQADFISVFGSKEDFKGQLYNWLRPGESDVFIYYSGHGAPGLNTGQGYLLPVDANPNTVELNGYPLETLYANLGKLPAKSVTVVIDACFSGNSQGGMVVKNASPAMLKVVETRAALPNATVLTAAGISEIASWDSEAKLGLFTRHFLEGVAGKADQPRFGNRDGTVTLGELKGYLESEVAYMARRLYMREQHPQVSGNAGMIVAVAN